jgi:hypothetical protein
MPNNTTFRVKYTLVVNINDRSAESLYSRAILRQTVTGMDSELQFASIICDY